MNRRASAVLATAMLAATIGAAPATAASTSTSTSTSVAALKAGPVPPGKVCSYADRGKVRLKRTSVKLSIKVTDKDSVSLGKGINESESITVTKTTSRTNSITKSAGGSVKVSGKMFGAGVEGTGSFNADWGKNKTKSTTKSITRTRDYRGPGRIVAATGFKVLKAKLAVTKCGKAHHPTAVEGTYWRYLPHATLTVKAYDEDRAILRCSDKPRKGEPFFNHVLKKYC